MKSDSSKKFFFVSVYFCWHFNGTCNNPGAFPEVWVAWLGWLTHSFVCSSPFLLVGRADPECMLGHLLRILFKNDDFMNAVGLLLTFLQRLSSVDAIPLLFVNSLFSLEVLTKLGIVWVDFVCLFVWYWFNKLRVVVDFFLTKVLVVAKVFSLWCVFSLFEYGKDSQGICTPPRARWFWVWEYRRFLEFLNRKLRVMYVWGMILHWHCGVCIGHLEGDKTTFSNSGLLRNKWGGGNIYSIHRAWDSNYSVSCSC